MSMLKTDTQKTLIAMRRRLSLTQQQLAVAMGVSLNTVSRWETIRSPTGGSLARIAIFAHREGDAESERIFLEQIFGKGAYVNLDHFKGALLEV
jgi:transcriptional regulator with XRE-family HTH domain